MIRWSSQVEPVSLMSLQAIPPSFLTGAVTMKEHTPGLGKHLYLLSSFTGNSKSELPELQAGE